MNHVRKSSAIHEWEEQYNRAPESILDIVIKQATDYIEQASTHSAWTFYTVPS